MKKVLFVIESLGGGGAEKVLSNLLKHIDKTKFDVTLCVIADAGNYADEVKQYVKYCSVLPRCEKLSSLDRIWYKVKYKLVYQLLPMSWVYRLWIPKGFDTEVAFCEGFVTKLMAFSTNKHSHKITWVHIDLKYNPWPQIIGVFKSLNDEKVAYSCYDDIVCVSKTVENSFKEVYGLADKVHTIYNPIDVDDIRSRSKEEISAYDSKQFNIVTVGRLVDQKGYDILVRVCKKLKEDGINLKLRILGEGSQRTDLEEYIKSNDLNDNVELLGFKSNPYPYIANSDLFVCSSRSEGYSLVIAESLVLGVPVISTYCSGPNELLDEGKYGMLVDIKEDGSSLYAGIREMFDNKAQLEKYQMLANERGNQFNLVNVLSEIELLLKI